MIKNKILTILASISFTIFFFCISVSAVFACRFIYYFDIDYLKIAESNQINKETLIRNYDVLIDYCFSFSDAPLEFPDFPQSEQGQIHFEEVRDILRVFIVGTPIFGVLSAILAVIMKKQKPYRFLKYASLSSILIPLVAGALIMIDFDSAFTLFHQIFFDNDYWLFDPVTDPVIMVLPEEFFMHCAIFIVVFLLLFCGTSYGIYRLSLRNSGSEQKY